MAQPYDPTFAAVPGVRFLAKSARPGALVMTALADHTQAAAAVATELSAEQATYPGWYVMAAYTNREHRNDGLITECIVAIREALAERGVDTVYLLQSGEHDVSKGTAGTITKVAEDPELPQQTGATHLYALTA